MAYQVLARKWRPSNFTQLVGQEHVSQSLIHALQHDRLHHAYLFTGARGVGKTTIARILAKAINCENLQDFNPCGECRVCRDFEQGRFMDLIEVDAASRTKVDDTRELLENVQYAPNLGRYKVYLIDEVHMLSGHSFNALLKTLEEPPDHVKFLLATTDPHKIPVTVLSRCLQFNLKRLQPEQISKQLHYILDQENIGFEAPALKLLARAADGSLRDALSLLDQAIAYGGGKVSLDSVTGMLGTVAQQPIDAILYALASGDAKALFTKIGEIADLTPDFSSILPQILRVLHRIALVQQFPEFIDDEFDEQLIQNLARLFTPEDVQLFYQIGLLGQRDLDLAPDERTGFEMVMLRMLTFRPQTADAYAETSSRKSTPPPVIHSPAGAAYAAAPPNKPAPEAPPAANDKPGENWPEIIARLQLTGLSRELANNCILESIDEKVCRLQIDPGYKQISVKAEEKLGGALQKYYSRPLKLLITPMTELRMTPAHEMQKARDDMQQAAIDSIETDKNIHDLKNTFSARIVNGSIESLNE